jgi:hypothetical protein
MASRARRPALDHTLIALVVARRCLDEEGTIMARVGKLMRIYLE